MSCSTMSYEELTSEWLVGDAAGMTWHEMLVWFLRFDYDRLMQLMTDIYVNGINNPILLGSDGRVWDGHHRTVLGGVLDRPIPYRHVTTYKQAIALANS